MKKNLLLFVCMLLMLPMYSQTDTLRVDFDRSDSSDPETGWEIMSFGDKAVPSSDFSSFTAMGTTLKAKVLMLDEAVTDGNSTRAINRGGTNYADEKYSLLSDWIAADVMGGSSRTLAVQVTGIPAGTYTWKSYHHDFKDQVGRFQAKIENKAGIISDFDSIYQISLSDPNSTAHVGYANTFLDVTKYFIDAVVSAGPTDTITVHFRHEFDLGDGSIDHPNKLLILNGFELYETPAVLPEIIHVSPEILEFNGAYTKTFTVTGENLTEDITISTLDNCIVSPSTLESTSNNETVSVTFDGAAAVSGYIYLTSGNGKDSVLISATEYEADTLRVDFNKKGITTTEPGWNVLGLSDKQIPSSEYSAFNALNSEVKVLPVFLNNPIAASTRAVDRNKTAYTGELYEVMDDYIAADCIAGDAANGDHCNAIALKVTGVPAGIYAWKSYHHDTDNQHAQFRAKVENKAGVIVDDTTKYQTSFSSVAMSSEPGYATTLDGVCTYSFSGIVSAGLTDTITISFTNIYPYQDEALSSGVQGMKFVLISGFELTEAESEPLTEVVFVTPSIDSRDTTVIKEIAGYEDGSVYNVTVLAKAVIETADLDQLNAADVVIMGRNIGSSDVGTAMTVWDEVTAPVISTNMWGLRGVENKAFWTPIDDCANVTSDPDTILQAEILVAEDPVFEGISETTIDWWGGMFSVFAADDNYNGAGNGVLLAKSNDNRPLFIRWKKDVEFYAGAGHAPKGDRTFIGCGNDDTEINYFGFSDVAKGIFFNELARLVSGEPTVIPSADATLSELTVSLGSLSPEFDAATKQYTVNVPAGTTEVTVTGTANDTGAVVTGDGAIDVSSGSGIAEVLVMAPNNTGQVYSVSITVDPTSVELTELSTVVVYPTVSSDNFTVKAAEGSVIEVYNVAGSKVKSVISSSVKEEISVEQAGVYLIKVNEQLFKVVKTL